MNTPTEEHTAGRSVDDQLASDSLMRFLDDKEGFFIDEKRAVASGRLLSTSYRSASPFPHIVIDDLLPRKMLRRVVSEFPSYLDAYHAENSRERVKFQYTPERITSKYIRDVLCVLNSRGFLAFLEEMTGLQGLIPDPYFLGGGLHETRRGGFLGIHADFNRHSKLRLQRRLNLLVYLNEDWDPSYNGSLELWNKKMTSCETSVPPVMGKSVVFSTDSRSYHGHPDPLLCPPDNSRRSIALYYYTAESKSFDDGDEHSTLFKERPQERWLALRSYSLERLVRDITPPIIRRSIRAVARNWQSTEEK